MVSVIACALTGWLAGCGGSDDDDDDGGAEAGSGNEGGDGATSGRNTGGSSGSGTDKGGRGGSGGSSGSSATAGKGGTSNGASGEGGGSNTDGLAYPLTLSPIGTPNVSTAHVSLYFTVTDADGEPVSGLRTGSNGDLGDFVAKEDDTKLDPFESAFRVTHPTAALVIPTVLLLDLSRSVVEAGALDDLKDAAKSIISSLDPAQRLAIVTFASEPTTRQTFTNDKTLLNAAIDAIDKEDGISTNLYGSLQYGYGLWEDGFRVYDEGVTEPQLVAGLLIAVSDGNDTASVSTLNQVVTTRRNKRTVFIRVGEDLDRSVADEIANAGVIDAEGGFDELDDAVDAATDRISKLNGAIYAAEYCSPKRAGQHDLLFTVEGNESYLNGGSDDEDLCVPTGVGPSCSETSSMYCGSDPTGVNDYVCCAPTHPFLCTTTDSCYATQEAAYSACSGSCRACNQESGGEGGSVSKAGPAIELSFTASAFSDAQCAELFDDDDDDDGSGGEGGGGNGTAGSGPGPAPGDVEACMNFREAINTLALTQDCSDIESFLGCGLVEDFTQECTTPAVCAETHQALLECLTGAAESGDDIIWSCEGSGFACQASICETQIADYNACRD